MNFKISKGLSNYDIFTFIFGSRVLTTRAYASGKLLSYKLKRTSLSTDDRFRSQPFTIGSQFITDEDIKTIPFLDTVAGEALSILCTSKIILQLGDMGIRSPLASVNVLLSSSTEFKFSIQMASTGPSRINHTCSPLIYMLRLK